MDPTPEMSKGAHEYVEKHNDVHEHTHDLLAELAQKMAEKNPNVKPPDSLKD